MLDTLLFVVFPYMAVLLAVGAGVYRYFSNRFSYSSLSSELVEKNWLFWGAVPWHYGVVPTLLIHLAGFAVPGLLAILHGNAIRLYILELIGKAFALLSFAGIVVLILRRLTQSRIRVLTSAMDWVVLVLLLNQIFLGLWLTFLYRWGAAWYIHTATPWVVSLATFHPRPDYVTALPLVPRLHFLNATLLIALFPFSRLVHLVTFPITYLYRRLQIVIWYRRPAH
jgi:nitrate reductase gamma subunit